jgi:hypothetical protein
MLIVTVKVFKNLVIVPLKNVKKYLCTVFAETVQLRSSKSERFFYSLIFTLNHRRPKMSQFDTSVKKIIESIFLNATSHSDSDI